MVGAEIVINLIAGLTLLIVDIYVIPRIKNPLIKGVFLIGSLLVLVIVLLFSNKEQNPSATESPATQHAVEVVRTYYERLNSAANDFDYEEAWDMLSYRFQGNYDLNHNIANFIPFWSGDTNNPRGIRVRYALFGCAENDFTVDVHLVYYYRDDESYREPIGSEDWLRLTLDYTQEPWKINTSTLIDGTSCKLAFSTIEE